MDCFLEFISSFRLHEFYLHLSFKEKHLMRRFGSYMAYERSLWTNFNKATFLWVTAANAIPAGEKEFAKKLLYYALTLSKHPKDTSYIHSNLAQVYQDENNINAANYHCTKTIATGYYNKWAVDTLITNHFKTGKLIEAREICKTIIAHRVYQKDRPKYEKLLAYFEMHLEMPVH